MNSLRTGEFKSKDAAAPHLMFLVDDTPLDEFLAARYNDPDLVGLVPTLLDWLTDPAERDLAWQRIDPPSHSPAIWLTSRGSQAAGGPARRSCPGAGQPG